MLVKSFNTLRGFVAGNEKQGAPRAFTHYAILRVFSEVGLDFENIGTTLGVSATTTLRRGERVGPRSPASKGDLWMYRAPVSEERELSEHIDALWQTLRTHTTFLRMLKERATVEIILGYSSNIDHAGVRIGHASLEMFTTLEVDMELNIVVLGDD
jgi:hypothetical protein